MTFVKKGVVLPLGAGGDFDDRGTVHPATLEIDGEVHLYYIGYDGLKYRVGSAVSEDGIHFGRQGVVLPLGASGQFDDRNVYHPSLLKADGKTWMYYAGDDGNKGARIGLATSPNGDHFVRQGVCLPIGQPGDFDDNFLYQPSVLKRDGETWLYYTGHDGSTFRIGLAVSRDGLSFNRSGVVLPLGTPGEFDSYWVAYPAVLQRGGQTWLYYAGAALASGWQIGLAISDDGIHFTKLGVVLSRGVGGQFDDVIIDRSAVTERDGKVLMYYTGHDGARHRIGLAISEDGL